MAYQNPQYAGNTNFYGPLSRISEEDRDKAFGAGMGGNSIKAVGGGFKEKNTGKMILKTGAQIAGTIYGGPAGGMAAGAAVDMAMPDKQSVKSGTSGFGNPQGGGSQSSMQGGGGSNPTGSLVNTAMAAYQQYNQADKAAGPLADEATQMALDENTADLASSAYAPATDATANAATDAAADGAGNGLMYVKAAVDVSNKLNESGVTASEAPVDSQFNMDASTTNLNKNNGPLNPLEEEDDMYNKNKNMSAFAPLGGNR